MTAWTSSESQTFPFGWSGNTTSARNRSPSRIARRSRATSARPTRFRTPDANTAPSTAPCAALRPSPKSDAPRASNDDLWRRASAGVAAGGGGVSERRTVSRVPAVAVAGTGTDAHRSSFVSGSRTGTTCAEIKTFPTRSGTWNGSLVN